MKNFIGTMLSIIGLIILISAPLYQSIDMTINNTEGDGVERYGDNPIFRNILGVKEVYKEYVRGSEDGWITTTISVETPPWMRKLGLPEHVTSDYSNLHSEKKPLQKVIAWLCGYAY